MKEKIHIIIADDNLDFIEGLKVVLRKCKEYIIIDEFQNGKQLSESPQLIKADLILTDIEMPVLNGIKAAQLINFKYPKLPIVALTMHIDTVFLEDIFAAGFKGFIHKFDVSKTLVHVIEDVLNNKFTFPDNLKNKK